MTRGRGKRHNSMDAMNIKLRRLSDLSEIF